ncbi:MAG: carotenoid biosynthesis protein [Cyclobacteriaceae bacterium]|nr:carotenoid biosynthesis protein [Cyclobacteriaceae bacterium]MCH8515429.1 carotenoid biosynthesis protein [Cyclobacteriaceae bacterium]
MLRKTKADFNIKIGEKNIPQAPLAIAFLAIIQTVGAIGLSHPDYQHWFQMLTPFNLLMGLAILMHFHREWNTHFIIFCIVTYLVGFTVEWAGVATGVIFGSYGYGSTLGWKLFDIPLMIGVNWLILVYITAISSRKVFRGMPSYLHILVGSLLMVFLDVFIEPVAMQTDMWSWADDIVPLDNYIAWFIVSLILHSLFSFLKFEKENTIALPYFGIYLLFFVLTGILL